MALIDPKYSIGIDAVDSQRARWIQIVDRFRAVGAEHLFERAGLEAAAHALEELVRYTKSQFASEERFIAAHSYPELEAHRKKHLEIEATISNLCTEIRARSTTTTALKLNLFITVWWMEHIMQEDAKYARFILGRAS